MVRSNVTRYGFEFGAADVTREYSDEKRGYVFIGLDTPKTKMQVYVTKTGKVRVCVKEGDNWRELK